MPIVAAQAEKDLAIYKAWTSGRRRQRLAQEYGVTRQSIDAAIARARKLQPPVPRAEVFEQSVEILDDGLDVFVPMMMNGDKSAGRLVDRLLGRRNEMLGLDSPAKPGPTTRSCGTSGRAPGAAGPSFTTRRGADHDPANRPGPGGVPAPAPEKRR